MKQTHSKNIKNFEMEKKHSMFTKGVAESG